MDRPAADIFVLPSQRCIPRSSIRKAGLVVRIDRTIRQRKLTQAAAAQLMGIHQPKISAMLAGRFRGYSVERLMRFLVALGHDVEIVVKPRRHGTAGLRVA
jgi:predicted XRE-type DNA-binding protein